MTFPCIQLIFTEYKVANDLFFINIDLVSNTTLKLLIKFGDWEELLCIWRSEKFPEPHLSVADRCRIDQQVYYTYKNRRFATKSACNAKIDLMAHNVFYVKPLFSLFLPLCWAYLATLATQNAWLVPKSNEPPCFCYICVYNHRTDASPTDKVCYARLGGFSADATPHDYCRGRDCWIVRPHHQKPRLAVSRYDVVLSLCHCRTGYCGSINVSACPQKRWTGGQVMTVEGFIIGCIGLFVLVIFAHLIARAEWRGAFLIMTNSL